MTVRSYLCSIKLSFDRTDVRYSHIAGVRHFQRMSNRCLRSEAATASVGVDNIHRAGGPKMSSTNEDGPTLGTPPEEGIATVVPGRPKGRPRRKPKGRVPTVAADLPDKPDPDHGRTGRKRKE